MANEPLERLTRYQVVRDVAPKLMASSLLALFGGGLLGGSNPGHEHKNPSESPLKENGPLQLDLRLVRSGEQRLLSYFTFSNEVPGYSVFINEPAVSNQIRILNIPWRRSGLYISLLNETSFPQPNPSYQPYVDVLMGTNESDIRIAGALFVERYTQELGYPPRDLRGESYLSHMLSATMIFGLCQEALQRGMMSEEDASFQASRYTDTILHSDQPMRETFVAFMNASFDGQESA